MIAASTRVPGKVQQAAKEIGAPVPEYQVSATTQDYGPNIQAFADQGFNVIVTVGFALGADTLKAAEKYPDIHFIGIDQFQGTEVKNVTGLIFHEEQSGYLAGVLAARLSKSGTIGAVLGTDQVPPVVAFKEGYEAGAKHANPDIKTLSTYHPGGLDKAFDDPVWGAQTAGQAIDQGADVIFGAGGKTGNGALQEVAKRTTKDKPLYCIGVDTDQWETLPEAHPCLVSSAMKLIKPGVIALIKQVADGTIKGGNFFGEVGLAPFHDFESLITDDLKAELDQVKADLASGKLQAMPAADSGAGGTGGDTGGSGAATDTAGGGAATATAAATTGATEPAATMEATP